MEETKKRKRIIEGNKKKKEKIDVTINVVGKDPKRISPIIGYFPSGFSPLTYNNASSDDSGSPHADVRLYRNVERTNRLQLVVRPNGSKVDFVGDTHSGEAAAPQPCTYSVGVLDKQTRTLKIIPIAANTIFRLEPRFGVSELQQNETLEFSKDELMSTHRDRLRELTLMYSTKRNIKQVKKYDSLRQSGNDPSAQEDLNKTLEGIQINKKALEVSDSIANDRNIPPHDMSATTPQMAYPLEKIIFKGEWEYLLDVLEVSQAGVKVEPAVYPSFVCNRAHKLDSIKDEAEKKRLGCVFSYMTHLIKFKDKNSIDGVSSAKYHKIPSILAQKFLSMFGDSYSNRLSDDKRDLLVSYVLVLTLVADDFKTNPSDIAKDLKMNAIALRSHYEHLGCKLRREQGSLIATLPVPLKFSEKRRNRPQRRR